MIPFQGNKIEEKENSTTIKILWRSKKDSFSSEVQITGEIILIKILKKNF